MSFHDSYHESWARLDPIDLKRVNDVLLQFKDNPSHPSLNLHPVKGASKGFIEEADSAGKEYVTPLDPPAADPSLCHPESTRPSWAK